MYDIDMSETPRSRALLPHYLRKETIGSMPLDEVRIIDQGELSVHPKDGELLLDDDTPIKSRERRIRKGRIAIMTAIGSHGEKGYVADLRYAVRSKEFAEPYADEAPDDTEEMIWWQEDKKHEFGVAACVYWAEKGSKNIEKSGDERFFNAAVSLVALVDELSVQQKKDDTKKKTAEDKPTKTKLKQKSGKNASK